MSTRWISRLAVFVLGAGVAACSTNEPRSVAAQGRPVAPLSPRQFVDPSTGAAPSSAPTGDAGALASPQDATPGDGGTDMTLAAGARQLDLPTALGIGGASSLQVELAREQLEEANARLDAAEALWIPDVRAGLLYSKHEGALQRTEGDVLQVSREAGYVGGGLFARVDLADAFLQPGAARHDLDAADADRNDLIHLAATSRPEIRGFMATVRAEEDRQRQETLRPFIPSVLLGVTAGGLGGGTGSDYEDFSSSGDLSLGLTWGIRNLGFGESAARRQEAAQTRSARVRLRMALDAVTQQVTIAHLEVRQGRRQVELAVENVDQSLNSLDLNMQRIHAAEGLPIEAMQAMRAAAEAQETYLESVSAFNRAQFRLLRAVGRSPERGVLADPPPGGDE